MSWLKSLHSKAKGKAKDTGTTYPSDAPPEWQPAPEQVHAEGLHADASEKDFEAAERFCERYPPAPSRLLSSAALEEIRTVGCRAWQLEVPATPNFHGVIYPNSGEKRSTGVIRVITKEDCQDACIMSNLPILAGLYDTRGRTGVYYEVKILHMDGVIAVGE